MGINTYLRFKERRQFRMNHANGRWATAFGNKKIIEFGDILDDAIKIWQSCRGIHNKSRWRILPAEQ